MRSARRLGSAKVWLRTPARSAFIVLTLSLLAAFLTLLSMLFGSINWFTPAGVADSKSFYTLGQLSRHGRFMPVAESDLRAAKSLGLRGDLVLYRPEEAEVRVAAEPPKQVAAALVSDNFFQALGIEVRSTQGGGSLGSGVVVSHTFWLRNRDAIEGGRLISVEGELLPVSGVASAEFIGLGDAQPEIWISTRSLPLFSNLSVPGRESDAGLSAALSLEVPFYLGILSTTSPNRDAEILKNWRVRNTDTIELRSGASVVRLGWDARGNVPAVLEGVDLTPEKTAVLGKYVALMAFAGTIVVIVGFLSFAAFLVSRDLERVNDLHMRWVLGATVRRLLLHFFSEALILIFVAVPISAVIYVALFQTATLNEDLREVFELRSVGLQFADLLPAFLLAVATILVIVSVPFALMRIGNHRSRQVGTLRSQRHIGLVLTTFQWFAVSVLALSSVSSMTQLVELTRSNWGTDAEVYAVPMWVVHDGHTLLREVGIASSELPLIQYPPMRELQNGSDILLYHGGKSLPLRVYFNESTPSALEKLGLELIAGRLMRQGSPQEVVVNVGALESLGLSAEAALGSRVTRFSFGPSASDVPFVIVGVVQNVHYADARVRPENVMYTAYVDSFAFAVLSETEFHRLQVIVGSERRRATPTYAKLLDGAINPRLEVVSRGRLERFFLLSVGSVLLLSLLISVLGVVNSALTRIMAARGVLALKVSLGASSWVVVRELLDSTVVAGTLGALFALGVWRLREGGPAPSELSFYVIHLSPAFLFLLWLGFIGQRAWTTVQTAELAALLRRDR